MKNRKITLAVFTVLLVTSVFFALFTVNAEYSDSDPLVTLSYINETVIPKITEDVKNSIISIIDEKFLNFEKTINDKITTQPEVPEIPEDPEIPEVPVDDKVSAEELKGLKYAVVHLEKGQKLMATGENTESLEVILRSGSVVALSPFADQGIADLTASKELYNNDPLVKNNYCIIPRGNDGRGIYADTSDAYILVRGEYEIVQQ